MGLIHSRASKRAANAQAAVLREEARVLRGARKERDREAAQERAGGNPWRQPTLGGAIAKFAERRRERGQQ